MRRSSFFLWLSPPLKTRRAYFSALVKLNKHSSPVDVDQVFDALPHVRERRVQPGFGLRGGAPAKWRVRDLDEVGHEPQVLTPCVQEECQTLADRALPQSSAENQAWDGWASRDKYAERHCEKQMQRTMLVAHRNLSWNKDNQFVNCRHDIFKTIHRFVCFCHFRLHGHVKQKGFLSKTRTLLTMGQWGSRDRLPQQQRAKHA